VTSASSDQDALICTFSIASSLRRTFMSRGYTCNTQLTLVGRIQHTQLHMQYPVHVHLMKINLIVLPCLETWKDDTHPPGSRLIILSRSLPVCGSVCFHVFNILPHRAIINFRCGALSVPITINGEGGNQTLEKGALKRSSILSYKPYVKKSTMAGDLIRDLRLSYFLVMKPLH
jgi:hypothetical protein